METIWHLPRQEEAASDELLVSAHVRLARRIPEHRHDGGAAALQRVAAVAARRVVALGDSKKAVVGAYRRHEPATLPHR